MTPINWLDGSTYQMDSISGTRRGETEVLTWIFASISGYVYIYMYIYYVYLIFRYIYRQILNLLTYSAGTSESPQHTSQVSEQKLAGTQRSALERLIAWRCLAGALGESKGCLLLLPKRLSRSHGPAIDMHFVQLVLRLCCVCALFPPYPLKNKWVSHSKPLSRVGYQEILPPARRLE